MTTYCGQPCGPTLCGSPWRGKNQQCWRCAEIDRLRAELAVVQQKYETAVDMCNVEYDHAEKLQAELDALRKQEPSHYAVLDDSGEIIASDTSKRALLSRGCAALGPTVELYASPVPPAAVTDYNVDLVSGDDGYTEIVITPAPVAQKVQDGFVLVPKEPTSDMLIAGFKQLFGGSDNDVVARAYRAMLAAAQAQEGK